MVAGTILLLRPGAALATHPNPVLFGWVQNLGAKKALQTARPAPHAQREVCHAIVVDRPIYQETAMKQLRSTMRRRERFAPPFSLTF